MSIEQYFEAFAERLHSSAHVRTVYGEPVETQHKTVIPVSKVRYAFGGGPAMTGETGVVAAVVGGGGAVQVEPVGVFEVTDAGTRFVPVESGKAVVGALVAGFLVGVLMGRLGTSR